ncbi:hypothetical protein [Sporomusa malonica]|uniref:Uncharacterized protein n=1 Tax=Sporomusa malonica TaxID=112901 RepID=A0A1W2AXV7_9FIRM|nr:hypothetical protein [Sporomusa malonica]SMC65523.1 hypothetical protein SAMN04488500_106200 [Sporomusa malonica]
MSIRSIDMQVLIPRATEAQKHQSSITQQGTLQQQQFAEQMQKIAEVRQQQVQGLVKGQGGKVERDETKDQHSKQRSNRYPQQNTADGQVEISDQENSENAAIGQDPVLGHIIDIKM